MRLLVIPILMTLLACSSAKVRWDVKQNKSGLEAAIALANLYQEQTVQNQPEQESEQQLPNQQHPEQQNTGQNLPEQQQPEQQQIEQQPEQQNIGQTLPEQQQPQQQNLGQQPELINPGQQNPDQQWQQQLGQQWQQQARQQRPHSRRQWQQQQTGRQQPEQKWQQQSEQQWQQQPGPRRHWPQHSGQQWEQQQPGQQRPEQQYLGQQWQQQPEQQNQVQQWQQQPEQQNQGQQWQQQTEQQNQGQQRQQQPEQQQLGQQQSGPRPRWQHQSGSGQVVADGSCTTIHDEDGRCVKSTMCMVKEPKSTSPHAFTYRSLDSNPCGFLKMCCPIDKVRSKPVLPTFPPTRGCGYSNSAGGVFREKADTSSSGRADFAEFPWMVALLRKKQASYYNNQWDDQDYIGGGSLIHPSVVLTAAHKVDSLTANQIKCRAGEWNTLNETEALPHQERDVQRIAKHPEFVRLDSYYNAALLFLETPFSMEAHINVACLSRRLPPPGTICYGMGWGEDFTNTRHSTNVLKKITLPLVGAEDCQRQLQNTILGEDYVLHNTLTCAGGAPDVDMCIGDGGSPLVCHIGDPVDLRYAVVGMVAYGLERCGIDQVPGVYVNVPQIYHWVGHEMDLAGL